MYEYLKGYVTIVKPTYIVIDVNGVGYRLAVANPYVYEVNLDQLVTLYVYQAVKDDSITLFGFQSGDEKELFEKLISVSGIGPKSGIAILANPDHQALIQAIRENDANYLAKFPGIGKKTASRIIIELQDKVDSLLPENELDFTIKTTKVADNPVLEDGLAALKALGYAERDVKRVEKKLLKGDDDLTTDQYLREGLKLLD